MKKKFLIFVYILVLILVGFLLVWFGDLNSANDFVITQNEELEQNVDIDLELDILNNDDINIENIPLYDENISNDLEDAQELPEVDESQGNTDDIDNNVDNNEEVYDTNIESTSRQAVDDYISQIYDLQSAYVASIESVVAQTIADFKSFPIDEQTDKNKQELVYSKVELLTELEGQCDENMNQILDSIRIELEKLGEDDSLIYEIKSEYNEQKATWKAQALSDFSN